MTGEGQSGLLNEVLNTAGGAQAGGALFFSSGGGAFNGWPLAALAGGLGGGLGDGLRGAGGAGRGRAQPLSAEEGVRHVLAPLVDSYHASMLGAMAPYFDQQTCVGQKLSNVQPWP